MRAINKQTTILTLRAPISKLYRITNTSFDPSANLADSLVACAKDDDGEEREQERGQRANVPGGEDDA